MCGFLDPEICTNLRKVVNSSKIFYADNQEKANYNLICTVMDRVDTSVECLQKYNSKLESENDIILFFVHSCIIVSAVKEILKYLKIKVDTTETNYFSDICMSEPLSLDKDTSPSDDKFFEYIRSLVFAHPFETNRINFVKQMKDIHYSPFLIPESNCLAKKCIGIMVYSKKNLISRPIYVPYKNLKDYITDKYQLLELATLELKKRIQQKQRDWKTQRINRKQEAEKILKDICLILKERFEDVYEVEILLKILQYHSQNSLNTASVNIVKNVIIDSLPKICDCVESLDYNELADIIDEIINIYPNDNLTYELGKILSCDKDDSSMQKQFCSLMAKIFFQNMAHKWVYINIENMDFEEIKLLTRVACYLEAKNEKDTQNE